MIAAVKIILDFQVSVEMKQQPNSLSLKVFQDHDGLSETARLVNKPGDKNIDGINVPEKSARFLKDIVHTLVQSQTG